MRYLVLAAEPWAREITWPILPGDTWTIAADEAGMMSAITFSRPFITFVLHWHHKIIGPWLWGSIFVGFHASDLPNFRGGDPIGNQLRRGITDTKLTAFRLTSELDAGPILLQRDLSLLGTRYDVFERIKRLVGDMVPLIVAGNYTERPQVGEGSFYRRADASRASQEAG